MKKIQNKNSNASLLTGSSGRANACRRITEKINACRRMTMSGAESGRSMVEMLGTLAIIGVLSIGGIAGYSYGMDKYRANQTINDVMLMGVDIITQTSRGVVPNLSEWGTKTSQNYDFTVVRNPDDATQYGIQITGVPSRICKIVGDGLKSTVAVYVGNTNYKPNDTADPCDSSDKNTMEFYFGSINSVGMIGTECKIDSDCGDNNYCDNGLCFKGEKPLQSYGGQVCTTTADCPGDSECVSWCDSYSGCHYNQRKSCTNNITGNAGLCINGDCIEGDVCTYDQYTCGSNKYCATTSSACSEKTTGQCIPIDFTRHTIQVNGKSETWYLSNTYMSARDAEVACRSMGKTTFPSNADFIDGSSWSERAVALMDLLNGTSGYFWTSETYEDKGGDRTCIYANPRNTPSLGSACEGIAVCK